MPGGALATNIGTAFFDALPDGILLAGLDGKIRYVNSILADLAGYRAEDLVGLPVETLIPDAARDRHQTHRDEYVTAGMPARPMGTDLKIRLRTRGGDELPVDISLRPLVAGGETLVVAAVRDATERIRALGRIEAMLEISQHILKGQPPEEVLALIARRARELAGAAFSTVSVPSGEPDELVIMVADGYAEDRLRGSRLPLNNSLAGEVFRRGETVVVEDAIRDRRAARQLVERIGYGAAIVVPLVVGGTIFGTLTVANVQGGRQFNPFDVRLVELFATQASVALEYSRIREELGRLALVEDRERIGRELHDGVIQSLFAVGMNLEATAAIAGPGEVQDRVRGSVGELDRSIRDLRNYIFGLRPGILADRQLTQAIQQLADETAAQSGIAVAVEIDSQIAAQLASVAGDLVQIIRESLSNVVRHSGAATCRVSLGRDGSDALLAIEDDGHGFDLETSNGGFGLGNLRDRAKRLGGLVTIAAGEGTLVEVRLPL